MCAKATCLVACCLCVSNSAAPTEKVVLNASKLEPIRELFQDWIDSKRLPSAAILVLHDGETVFEHHAGNLDVELENPVQADSLFRIYSMTKPVTAIAVMKLVEDGKLALDDPISNVLPEFQDLEVYGESGNMPADPMTLRHLLAHSAGLTYGYYGNTPVDLVYREAGLIDDWDYLVPTTHDLVVELGKLPLLFNPGQRFHYSFASDVLSQVVERASGESFDVHLQNALWSPIGVKDAYFDVPDAVIDRFGTNHFRTPDGKFVIQDTPRSDPEFRDVTFLSGGGGLVMTLSDFGRFAQMLVDLGQVGERQLIKESTLREVFTNQVPSPNGGFKYGLGFGIRERTDPTDEANRISLYYWGGAAGTSFWVDLENRLAVVFGTQLINSPGDSVRMVEDIVYGAFEKN